MAQYMNQTQQSCGVILCGGRGTRTGGADKGLLRLGGELAVTRAAALLRPLCSQLLISVNRNHERYRELALGEVITDQRPGFAGPLAGIETAWQHTQAEHLLVLPCDLPYLPSEVPERLLSALRQSDTADAVYARTAEGHHYLCAALHRRCAATVTHQLDGEYRSVRGCLAILDSTALTFDGAAAAGFRNLNDSRDWDSLPPATG